VTAVRFADGGRTLATSAADGAVRLWQLPGPVLAGPTDSVFSVQFTAGGNRLAVAGGTGDNAVRIWDVRDPRAPTPAAAPVLGPPDAQFTGAMVVSPDGRTIATGSTDGTVRLWRGGTPTVLHGPTAAIQSLAFSPNGDTLAAGGNDQRVWLWQVADPRRAGATWPPAAPTTSSGSGTCATPATR
jgi:WD40 repeat protein